MEFVGILIRIGDLENTNGPSAYVKRPIFVKYYDSKGKEQLVKFVFQEPNLDLIKNFQINDKIKVIFDFRGFDSTKTGKYFEEKIALSVSPFEESNNRKNNLKFNLPPNGKVSPDFTRSYEEFPDKLLYN